MANLIRVASFGYYNVFGIFATVLINISFLFLKVSIVLILASWSLSLHLKTQVLTHGRILLIAYDQFDRETLRYEVLSTPTPQEKASSKKSMRENRFSAQYVGLGYRELDSFN